MNYLYKLVTIENVEINYDAFKKKELIECLTTMRDIYFSLKQENQQLKDNWNELRKWIVYNKHNENTEQHYLVVDYGTLLGKMQELEQGSDSNGIK